MRRYEHGEIDGEMAQGVAAVTPVGDPLHSTASDRHRSERRNGDGCAAERSSFRCFSLPATPLAPSDATPEDGVILMRASPVGFGRNGKRVSRIHFGLRAPGTASTTPAFKLHQSLSTVITSPASPFRLAEARAYLALKGECAMTKDINTWRREADRLLGAPVVRVRSISTVAGKVADRFDQVMAARQRGMPWRMIADALGTDGELKEESVESAFRRLCSERSLALPGRRKVEKSKTDETGSTGDRPVDAAGPTSSSLGRLSEEQERWVDDGDD